MFAPRDKASSTSSSSGRRTGASSSSSSSTGKKPQPASKKRAEPARTVDEDDADEILISTDDVVTPPAPPATQAAVSNGPKRYAIAPAQPPSPAAKGKEIDETQDAPAAQPPPAKRAKTAGATQHVDGWPTDMPETVKKVAQRLLQFKSDKIKAFVEEFKNIDGAIFAKWVFPGQAITEYVKRSLNIHNIDTKGWKCIVQKWDNEEAKNGYFIFMGPESPKKAGTINSPVYVFPPLNNCYLSTSTEKKASRKGSDGKDIAQSGDSGPNFYAMFTNTFPEEFAKVNPVMQAQANLFQILLHIGMTRVLEWTLDVKNIDACWDQSCWSAIDEQLQTSDEIWARVAPPDDPDSETEDEARKREDLLWAERKKKFLSCANKGFIRKQHGNVYHNIINVKCPLLIKLKEGTVAHKQWEQDRPSIVKMMNSKDPEEQAKVKEHHRILLATGKKHFPPRIFKNKDKLVVPPAGVNGLTPCLAMAQNVGFRIFCQDRTKMKSGEFGIQVTWNPYLGENSPQLVVMAPFPQDSFGEDMVQASFNEFRTKDKEETEDGEGNDDRDDDPAESNQSYYEDV